jgi:polyisoprenoid-binding protein YceI
MSRVRSTVLGLVVAVLLLPLPARSGTRVFSVDPVHSQVGFKVRHLVSKVAGEFENFTANVTLDPDDVAGTLKLEANIETASISTDNERRDQHLRSDDFFNAEKYPQIRFVSKSVEAAGGDKYRVTGDLTIRNVTKEVTLDVEYFGTTTNPFTGTPTTGLDVTGEINRQDFGVSWNKTLDSGGVMLSDMVDLDIHVEATVPKA